LPDNLFAALVHGQHEEDRRLGQRTEDGLHLDRPCHDTTVFLRVGDHERPSWPACGVAPRAGHTSSNRAGPPQERRNSRRSPWNRSFIVKVSPCGAPSYTFSWAPLMIFTDFIADTPIGTIWSSSPWMINVGTSIASRSIVVSVSENALMQSYAPLRPQVIDM